VQAAARRLAAGWLALCLMLGPAAAPPTRAQPSTAPQVTLQSVDGIALQGATAILDLTLNIRNTSSLALPLHKLRFALQLDGVDVALGISTAPVNIPAQQQAQVPVQVNVGSATLLGILSTLPPDGRVHYTLTGTAEIGQTLLQIPFTQSGAVKFALH